MRAVQSVYNKKSSICLSGKIMFIHTLAFRQLLSSALALILLLILGESFHTDILTLGLSALTGISTAACMLSGLMAMQSGTIVLVNLFSMAGLLIPCVFGVFMFGENISCPQIVGLVLFLISAYLLIGCSKKIYRNFSWRTALLLAVSMVSNGITMLSQKMFSFYVHNVSVSLYTFYSFAIAGVLLIFLLFALSKKQKTDIRMLPPSLLGYSIALSVALFAISQCATMAASKMPSVILFTLSDGGGLIISSGVAAAMFHEKLNFSSVSGIICGMLSLIIINAFR